MTSLQNKPKGGRILVKRLIHMNRMVLLLIPVFLSLNLALSSYCDLDLNPLIDFNNVTLNMTRLNETHYRYEYFDNTTNTTDIFTMSIDCSQEKTFFIINNNTYPENETHYEVELGDNISVNFIVSPVIFTNYTISSWGIT